MSTSMYVDPMSMYREYIQNSADAVELARSAGLLREPGLVEIRMDQPVRTVFIRDNGAGIGKDGFVQQLTALGGSKKRGTGARGFRGVGRLAGLAFCQELIFRSRQNGESTVHELRWDSRQVRSLLRASDDSSDLREIVSRTVEVREVPGRGWPERFFEVELRGMVRHRDDRLLNEEAVANYLSQVAPVPFGAEFHFADQIRSFLEKHGVQLGVVELEITGRGQIYRPHRNSISMGKSGQTEFQELTTIYTPGRDGEVRGQSGPEHSVHLPKLREVTLVQELTQPLPHYLLVRSGILKLEKNRRRFTHFICQGNNQFEGRKFLSALNPTEMLGSYTNFFGKLGLAHIVGLSCCPKELAKQCRLVHRVD